VNSLATGVMPASYFPPNVYGELRSYLPPDCRVSFLALAIYCGGITPWSWVMREPDWLLGHDPDVVTAQRVKYAADEVAHKLLMEWSLQDALVEAEKLAQASGRTLFTPTKDNA
jgi:hypothetical protein